MGGESACTGSNLETRAHCGLNGAPREPSAARVHQQRIVRTVPHLRAPWLVVGDRRKRRFRNRNDALLSALAHHAHQLRAPVNRVQVEGVQLGEP
ncbi:MAG TPA: hypothetical protein DCF71_17425 [Gemmatimonadetes bacterium]|nr:hypothetical protein [Gemmatimonadota bacterium]